MNHSSAASSSANPVRQGEKRKRVTEPQPPPQSNNNGSATRARIVEILASTANGCLSELGYYPGMPGKLKILEGQNERWREENVKLYQDNQRLVELTRNQNTTISLSQIPDLDKLQRITDLMGQVNKLISDNVELRKVFTKYSKLQQDHAQLFELYKAAYDEVQRQGEFIRSTGLQYPPPQMVPVQQGQLSMPAPQQLQSLPTPNSQRPAMSVPHIQTQQLQQPAQFRQVQSQQQVGQQQMASSPVGIAQTQPQFRQVQGQQHQTISSPVGVSPSQPQLRQVHGQPQLSSSPVGISPSQTQFTQKFPHQGQRTELVQTKSAVIQNRQHSNSNPGSRRSSLNIVSPSMYEGPVHGGQTSSHPVPQIQPGQPQQQPQYAPNHAPMRQDAIILPNGTREIRRASHPTTLNHLAPSGPVPQTMQAHPNAVGPNPTTPIAYGYTPNGNPYPIFPGAPAHGHSNPVPLPAPRRGSAPLPTIGALPNQSPDIPPPPLSALSLLAQNSLFTPPSPLVQSEMVSSTSPTQPAQPMTISPQDTYINPPGATQPNPISVTSPSFPLSGHTPETPIQNAGQSQVQSSVPIPYPDPMPYPPVATPIVANGTPSVPPAPSPSVSHQNPPFSGEPTIAPVEVPQELPESPHAPEPGPEQHMYPPGHDVEEAASHVAEQTHSSSAEPPPSNTVTPAPEDQNAMEVDVAEDEGEESEEEVELGPDGLRLVRDCLDQLFGEPIDGKVVCKLCEHRYNKNIVTEPPVPFVNATDEQLEAHCIDEHEYAWQELRTP